MRIAVIGTGISGNAAAYALAPLHDVVVYERKLRPGGHSATIDVVHDGMAMEVDTGFIVYNERNYPNLVALFDHLGVPTEWSDMSFAVSAADGALEWSSDGFDTVFAQRRNLVSPGFLWMLREIARFNRQALGDMKEGRLAGLSLGEYLAARRFSARFLRHYLLPMSGAIWSTAPRDMLAFPAETFVAFYDNHGLIHLGDRLRWRTVTGGSRVYVERMIARFAASLRMGAEVTEIRREDDGVRVRDARGHEDRFDHVVIASHSDQALAMLADPSGDEARILGAIRYRPSTVYLHRDSSLMPRRRKVWASWNYLGWRREDEAETDSHMAVSYWMNRLQNLDPQRDVFVSLDPPRLPRDDLTFGVFHYDHPQFDRAAIEAQRALGSLQGVRRTWYCGAYHGYGFHEDGLASGLRVAQALGAPVPWLAPATAPAPAPEFA